MKKITFGIFAHPDDEAFGPCAALLVEKMAGNEVHLILATAGENGTNPDNLANLGEIRLREWHEAGRLLEADSMNYLGYTDGMLSNSLYMEVASRIESIVRNTLQEREDIETIEFMSLDLGGLTGHLDHIFMARVACYVFYRLQAEDQRFTKIRLACLHANDHPASNCNWLYMDAGRTPEMISETIDASVHLEKIKEIMRVHHSQRGDYQSIIEKLGDRVAINYFVEPV